MTASIISERPKLSLYLIKFPVFTSVVPIDTFLYIGEVTWDVKYALKGEVSKRPSSNKSPYTRPPGQLV